MDTKQNKKEGTQPEVSEPRAVTTTRSYRDVRQEARKHVFSPSKPSCFHFTTPSSTVLFPLSNNKNHATHHGLIGYDGKSFVTIRAILWVTSTIHKFHVTVNFIPSPAAALLTAKTNDRGFESDACAFFCGRVDAPPTISRPCTSQ